MEELRKHPEIIYKYRNWVDPNHKSVLLKNQIYFTSPRDFNDPFDCRIPNNFSLLNTTEKIEEYVANMINSHYKEIVKRGVNIKNESERLKHRIANEPEAFQKEYENILFTDLDNHLGLFSLSERWNSLLMWSHYANSHQGFCVGFWQAKFQELDKFVCGPVFYPPDNEFPEIDPLDKNLSRIFIMQSNMKSKEWYYENEYRLSWLFYPHEPKTGERIFVCPDDFFAEILIGLKATQETKNELIQIGKDKRIKVFQIIQTPFKFEIDRVQVL